MNDGRKMVKSKPRSMMNTKSATEKEYREVSKYDKIKWGNDSNTIVKHAKCTPRTSMRRVDRSVKSYQGPLFV